MKRTLAAACWLLIVNVAWADGPRDNVATDVRPIPPPGVQVPDADRAELQTLLDQLQQQIVALRKDLKAKPALLARLPDVEVYHKAAAYALKYNEFHKPKEIELAKKQLQAGLERASQLAAGEAPWTTQPGVSIRGYRSKLDDSVQPYLLLIPQGYAPNAEYRLDAWFHGRGETLSEVNFLDGGQARTYVAPPRTFVLFLYGRYCNANKFAGEVDLFEALDDVQRQYPIDNHRLVVRGFSMGGAACWQFATHFASRWAAAAPGAGFSETADFLKVFQDEKLKPTWYEQKLWHWYDATDYAVNLFHCPTVAYSGEIDRQKQAADMMAKALSEEGITLAHLIGPQTAHAYHPETKRELDRRIDAIVARGREPTPRAVRFTTWTLRYNQMAWVTVDALREHWERARVTAELITTNEPSVLLATENVAALSLNFGPGTVPFDITGEPKVQIDGTEIIVSPPLSDRSWTVHLRRTQGAWEEADSADDGTLAKRHGLQGPIDDAFMDSFLMVRPTGELRNEQTAAWAKAELQHALTHWRQQFRGDARLKDDTQVTDDDIARHNLVLWGDPASNRVLAKLADKLPIRWDADAVVVGSAKYDAASHVPLLVYPNPLNPKRYVVLNSSFTYREYDYLNNARQTAKLPDWAIVDTRSPVTSQAPGKVVAAGFFDERWGLKP